MHLFYEKLNMHLVPEYFARRAIIIFLAIMCTPSVWAERIAANAQQNVEHPWITLSNQSGWSLHYPPSWKARGQRRTPEKDSLVFVSRPMSSGQMGTVRVACDTDEELSKSDAEILSTPEGHIEHFTNWYEGKHDIRRTSAEKTTLVGRPPTPWSIRGAEEPIKSFSKALPQNGKIRTVS
jgi:hypothetical protein